MHQDGRAVVLFPCAHLEVRIDLVHALPLQRFMLLVFVGNGNAQNGCSHILVLQRVVLRCNCQRHVLDLLLADRVLLRDVQVQRVLIPPEARNLRGVEDLRVREVPAVIFQRL